MQQAIADALVSHGRQMYAAPRAFTEFAGHAEADALLNDIEGNPYAFVLACIANRQIRAERAWMVPFEVMLRLHAAGFEDLAAHTEGDIVTVFSSPTSLHRYADRVARSVHRGIVRIASQYDGDASLIWRGEPSSAELVLRFLEFDGVGPKIATMAANILARDFKVALADYYSIDISADVHVRRVFTRLGLIKLHASVEEVIYRARALHPEFPGMMDLPCWHIGRSWCHARRPDCVACWMAEVCPSSMPAG